MVPSPSYLRALVGVVAGLLLAVPAAPGPAAAEPSPGPGLPPVVAAEVAPDAVTPVRPLKRRAPAPREYDAPLDIRIEQLTPGVLPRRGPLVVSGTVTNVDLETWRGINLYPMFSAGPGCSVCAEVMTTSAELDLASRTDPESPVGERYTDVSDSVAVLEPGASASYTIRIPQRVLRSLFQAPTTGVYWFGVHASGDSTGSPRDDFADGRARTFLPYVPPDEDDAVDTAVVVPLRGRIAHTADGRLGRTPGWQRSLSVQGALGGPLAFGAASGFDPVTWLVDPAVPDAVRDLARGNPPRAIEPVPAPEDPSESAEPSPTDDDDEVGDAADDGVDAAADDAVSRAAEAWLRQAQAVLSDDEVALLPYGDPDLSAAARGLPGLYRVARDHPSRVLQDWGVTGAPVVESPTGYVDQAGISNVDDEALLVLGDRMFPDEEFPTPPPTGVIGDRPVVVASVSAGQGGPGPDDPHAPVALRQRILSEAAIRLVRADADGPDPLVVVLPRDLTAAGALAFWTGLDVPWLDLTGLDDVADAAPTAREEIDPGVLSYPEAQQEAEIDGDVVVEVDRLVRSARTLQSILGEDYRIGGQLLEEALAGASYSLRGDPQAADRLGRTRAWVEAQLGQVTIDAPSGVTLSGRAGTFGVAVRNTLDHPVSVRIEATTDDGAQITVANPVLLAANSRSTVRIDADMSDPGVHNVRLRLTDLDGDPIGAEDRLPIRSGQAGVVIWAIIGAGVGILFVAIAIRLVRRVRSRDDATAAPATTEDETVEEPA